MMMPANYSVIAENEMTYVNGGASFIDAIGAVTAPIWNVNNVKTFSTNVVTLIGNKFMNAFIDNTLGVIFSGNATAHNVGHLVLRHSREICRHHHNELLPSKIEKYSEPVFPAQSLLGWQ